MTQGGRGSFEAAQPSDEIRDERRLAEEQALVVQGKSQPCDRLDCACAKGSAMIPKHPEALCELRLKRSLLRERRKPYLQARWATEGPGAHEPYKEAH